MTLADLERRLAWHVGRDPRLRRLRELARESGASLCLVGGMVRDAALGHRGVDIDLVACSKTSVLVRGIGELLGSRGFRFRKRGVTTWRFGAGQDAIDLVDASRRGLEADLRRRDLTINAIAYGLVDRKIYDPLGGLRDVERKRLRLVGPDSLKDDPLRALRLARFRAQLPDFQLARGSQRLVGAMGARLRGVSVERARDEMDKLLKSKAAHTGLETLQRLGLLPSVLPELLPMSGCAAGKDRPDVWTHTVETIAWSCRPGRLPGGGSIAEPSDRLALRWALLLHDIAKPETLAVASDGRLTFHGHEVIGARSAEALLERFRQPKALRKRVSRLIRWHLRPSLLAQAGAPERGLRRLVREAGGDLPLLVLHAACDAKGSGTPDPTRWRRLRHVLVELLARAERCGRRARRPLLSGDEIMRAMALDPGPTVGQVMAELEEARDAGIVETRAQAVAFLRNLALD